MHARTHTHLCFLPLAMKKSILIVLFVGGEDIVEIKVLTLKGLQCLISISRLHSTVDRHQGCFNCGGEGEREGGREGGRGEGG